MRPYSCTASTHHEPETGTVLKGGERVSPVNLSNVYKCGLRPNDIANYVRCGVLTRGGMMC